MSIAVVISILVALLSSFFVVVLGVMQNRKKSGDGQ